MRRLAALAGRLLQRSRRGQQGFTVLELTVAAALMALAVGVFGDVLISLMNTDVRGEALVTNEQSARFALTQMARDLRAAEPVDAWASISTFATEIQVEEAGSGTVVRWVYSPATQTLSRYVMPSNDASNPAAIGNGGRVLTGVLNASQTPSVPLLTYYNAKGEDMVNSGSFQPQDVANCTIRVHIQIASASQPGPQPYRVGEDVELRNYLPGGQVGC